MPDPGEGLTEAEVLTWHVAVGDHVRVNDVLLEEIAVRYGSAKAKGKVSAKFKMQQLNEADVRAAIAHYRDDMNEPINIEQ